MTRSTQSCANILPAQDAVMEDAPGPEQASEDMKSSVPAPSETKTQPQQAGGGGKKKKKNKK